MEAEEVDLFGNKIEKDVLLRDLFIEPPFSVLDTKTENWQNRKRAWLAKGRQSETGRKEGLLFGEGTSVKTFDYYRAKEGEKPDSKEYTTSIFVPALCELMYKWYCPAGGTILDPFAGGRVRGIVGNSLGFRYSGIELRQEQVDSNYEQGKKILAGNCPEWICGDSDEVLDNMKIEFDLVFSCPPYFDLEVYSKLPHDLSNMSWEGFSTKYRSIVLKACRTLKAGGYAIFVIGDVRDEKGYYRDFITETKLAFKDAGLKLYNDAILLNVVGSASMRANRQFSAGKKLVKIHQNVLVFYKP